jgi:cytochrome c553
MSASRSFRYSGLLACLVAGGACSSKSGSGNSGNAGNTGTNACTQNALTILFNPMYSAYDGVHTFQLPAIVNGIDPANVKITWSVADPSMVQLDPDPATGRVMMTMQKAGKTTISAQAGGLCGSAPLTITAATPDDWMAGSKRYNDGVTLTAGGGAQSADGAAAAQQAACTNCHGDTANATFKDVAHTPEQTGGFSDDELTDIFTRGTIPSGGYFDATIVPYALWQIFHQWDVGSDAKGVVVYLRSLTPATQKGSFNIGALFDGGVPDGGFQRPEGGFAGDAGASEDASTTNP